MHTVDGIDDIKNTCFDLLSDESKSSGGIPSKVFFPENFDDLRQIIVNAAEKKQTVRLIGNHTGTTGGSIPLDNEWVLSFSRMNRILQIYKNTVNEIILLCEPGITLDMISTFLLNPNDWPYKIPGQELLMPGSHFYPPDPTEMSAQLGGTVATNASGARSYRFGATRSAVDSLSIITPTGDTVAVQRGKQFNPPNGSSLLTEQGRVINIPPFTFNSPSIKNASGYYAKNNMDIIDLFIGCEGTLGAFASIGIKLHTTMRFIAGCSFFHSLDDAFSFSDFLRSQDQVASIELFDESALHFIDTYRKQFPDVIPSFPENATRAILWEFIDNAPVNFDSYFDLWESELLKYNSSFSNTWSGIEQHEIERLKRFRHALPETVNATIAACKQHCPLIRKIGTDTALPSDKFTTVYNEYISLIKKNNLAHAAFGHLGDHHIHINLLPSNNVELETALRIYDQIMDITIINGGTISAEHGVGKLKRKYLEKMYSQEAITQMKAIKAAFDPDWRFNGGTMLEQKQAIR